MRSRRASRANSLSSAIEPMLGGPSPALPPPPPHSPFVLSALDLTDRLRQRPWTTLSNLRRPVIFLPLGGAVLFFFLIFHHTSHPESMAALPATIHTSFDHVTSAIKDAAGFSSTFGPEWDCNPFNSIGRLWVDKTLPTENKWEPFDPKCHTSSYLNKLYRVNGDYTPLIPGGARDDGLTGTKADHESTREYLPWLVNRTILIHGDSIDRFHVKDFCSFLQGHLFLVSPDHPASPVPFRQPHVAILGADGEETPASVERFKEREAQERLWESRPRDGVELTSPWVCDIEEYGATFIQVFTWGFQGAEHFFGSERWYHAPASWIDRFEHVTQPLLFRLARHLNRPNILRPDIIEINSGYWDLRRFTEEDFTAQGFKSRPYPEDSPIPYTNLSPVREKEWEKEARKSIKLIARTFKGADGEFRSGPVILWRTLHHPHRHNYAPYPRVFALDSLALKVIDELKKEYETHHIDTLVRQSQHGKVKDSNFEEGSAVDDLGLDERLRIDYTGHMMLGQELHFRDLLHHQSIPGSWLWGNVILYELKRAVLRVGRTTEG